MDSVFTKQNECIIKGSEFNICDFFFKSEKGQSFMVGWNVTYDI